MRKRSTLTMVMLALVFTLMCPMAYGQDGGGQSSSILSAPWEVDIAPYLWGPGIFGDTTVRGRTANIDISAPDFISTVFNSLQFVAMGRTEVRRGPLVFTLDL